ncbi:hypothetical protein FNV43_RR23353 [Rhamnella rubrinervis]|uniref:NAB domain-containing protein n=1 Tax=Rhamnella rubrinervis TaxID=2594499 RepID=A0A8K0DWY9_9ROSA|nr:hypothetical protein FNV43_RR23353 [Rhamnella rubrinervis]
MATKSQADSRRMYSWWWDSHISPKNSKWLQENLTDMDTKVKQMITLLEEDAESFARRAEMYYKKRPELMKLVEEFYRAYRALAERYDHATGALRQAHRTMAEAFPNHVPFVLSDESPSSSACEADPHTPEMPHPMRALFDPDELQKDTMGVSSSHLHAMKRNGAFTEGSDPASRKGLKQFNDIFGSGAAVNHAKFAEGRARKGLNFHDVEERDQTVQYNGSHDIHARALNESDRVDKAETEILNLQKALAKLEMEKESGLLQYQQSLERLSNLESEFSRAQEDSKGLNDRANKAETEVQNLKEALAKLQAEREASLVQYQQCLEKISNLENSISSAQKDVGELDERAKKAEAEAETLKQDLSVIIAEKEAAHARYEKSLEMTTNLDGKILQAEENARRIGERADKAEHEVETLKQAVVKLTEEKEAAALLYQQCLVTISSLEQKLTCAQEEAQRLNSEIDNGVEKLKSAEERYFLLENSKQTLQSELESLVQKVGSQSEELTENQKELGRLWTCVQEERMRFMEAETAFQTLQHLHSQSQDELRSLVAELQNRAVVLKDMETHKQALEDEVQKVKEEHKNLNELNISSALSIRNLQDEILSLRETIRKLEEEVQLRVDQRNALQQEIYCLKEELNDLNKKHQNMLEQVESVGFDPECFGSSVKELQDENSKLKDICEADRSEKLALLEKLEIMEKLLEKNALLENSLADLNVELEGVRGKVKALEESCQSFLEENSTLVAEKTSLISQLQVTTENLGKLSEKNNVLENSLFDANAELEELKLKSKSLEDSYLLLNNEKSGLIMGRESLVSQLDVTQHRLEDMGNRYAEVEHKLSSLEKERESTLHMIEELRVSLDAEKQERASFAMLSETQLAGMEMQICHLQEEGLCRKKEYEEEQDRVLYAQIEILILQKCIQDLKEKNFSLFIEHQKLLEAFQKSEKLVSVLEEANIEQQAELKSFSEQNKILRAGVSQMFETFDIDANNGCANKVEHDQGLVNLVLIKLKETQDSLFRTCDENQQLVLEKSVLETLLGQLRLEGANLMSEVKILNQELRIQSEQFSLLQGETQILHQINEELRLKVVDGDHKEEVLMANIENLHLQLLDSQGAYQNLQEENCKVLEEKGSLKKVVSELEDDKCCLEEENYAMFGETLFHGNLSLVFNDIICKKVMELEGLNVKLNNLHIDNIDLEDKVRMLEGKLADLQVEDLHLKESLDRSDIELKIVKSVNDQLNGEIRNAKDLLSLKENEIQLWETQAAVFFGELQSSSTCETLLEGKFNELFQAYESLEERSNSKDLEIELLKEKVGTLEEENRGLRAQLAMYLPAITSLKDCMTSLENHALMQSMPSKLETEESQDAHLMILPAEICQRDEDHIGTCSNGISDLQKIESRIRVIEKTVLEKERLVMLENLNAATKLDTAMIEIEELKIRNSMSQENGHTSQHIIAVQEDELEHGLSNNLKLQRQRREISESGNEVLTKDIMLDQISESTSCGISKRETEAADNQMLELWETTAEDGSIDLKVGKTQKLATASADHHQTEAVKQRKSAHPSMESLIEKELGVDKLEISKRFTEPRQEGNKKKVLERLDSDVQKLANLQITIQDLKRKVEITEKTKKGKGIEYDTVKGQLEEAEETITKLFDANRKLMNSVEDGSLSSDGGSARVSDESGSVRRRRISEQARRGSEKIGRLQLEVQKLQFLLLKLDDEKENRGRTRITERKTRVLLRDYLYGGGFKTGRKHKKAPFCGCVQPPTKGD